MIEEAEIGGKHLSILGGEVVGPQILSPISTSTLGHDVCPFFEIEDREGAEVADAVDVHGELPKEIYQPVAAFGQAEP